MELERIDLANFPIIKEKIIREKKQKPLSFRELMAMEKQDREDLLRDRLSQVKYVADCAFDEEKNIDIIKIYDVVFFREIAVFTLRRHKIMSSRLLTLIRTDYRIEIKEEDFYDIRESRRNYIDEEEERSPRFIFL